MRYLVTFARFCWEFIVGDDWIVAAGIVIAFGATGLLAHHHMAAWWVMPSAALLLLGISLWRATRRTSR